MTKAKHNHHQHHVSSLAEGARALMVATADAAGEKVADARKRLSSALESARDVVEDVRDKAVDGAKATDEAIRENPYQAIGIAFGVGAVLGFLLSRRR